MTTLAPVANHLWQSTVFAALVALVTLAYRKNRASVRHALWLAASIKFLVPFAALAALGAQPGIAATIDSASRPFTGSMFEFDASAPSLSSAPLTPQRTAPIAGVIWLGGSVLIVSAWWTRWRRVGAIARAGARIDRGRELDTLRKLERQAGMAQSMTMVASPASLEPGVFGIVTPVLLWPAAIGTHLNAEQLATILAHEVAHVRRRDNLAATIQMLVEGLFWFHPLVWLIGARMLEERERACDEEVLRTGPEPQLYAKAILTACRVCVGAPVSCVAGVTGADLKKRIERIMTYGRTRRLTMWGKSVLTALPAAALIFPIAVGALNAPRLRAQTPGAATERLPEFEVASVKQNKSGPGPVRIETQPGERFSAVNVTLRQLIQNAYRLQSFQIAGGPDWLNSDRFDIIAKGADTDAGNQSAADRAKQPSSVPQMLRALLAERFKLTVRTETREMPIYSLVVAHSDGRLGPALHQSRVDCSAQTAANAQSIVKAQPTAGEDVPCGIRMGLGNMVVGGATLSQVASTLSGLLERSVVDRTGLTGAFDATLRWTPDQSTPGMAQKAAFVPTVDPNGPSIFTAVQEQLGLKLESTKGPVEVLVVVTARQPSVN